MLTQINKKSLFRNLFLKLAILSLFFAAAGTMSVHAKTSAAETTKAVKKNGWYTKNDCTFYYKDGKKQNGWQKIKGKTYYFAVKTGLKKNMIAGSKKNGFAYVDEEGVRINDPVMKMAVAFVRKNSSAKKTPEQRLESCFKALRKYPYVRYYNDKPAAKQIPVYASDMLKKKGGNCYRYGSAYAYIAKALGFDVRVAAGGTTAHRRWDLSPHGWCEVKIGKTWYIVDCSMSIHNPSEDLCLVKRSSYPFKLRCDKLFTMKIVKHKIKWTGEKAPWNNLKSKKLRLK